MTTIPPSDIDGTRRMAYLLAMFAAALIVRSLTGYFIGTHIDNAGWFPYGIFEVFDQQAKAVLDGLSPAFWITDASQTNAAVYPPGYSIWLALIYGISGLRSIHLVQVIQIVLDSASVLLMTAIANTAFSFRAGIATGFLAAFSPLLAYYGASPLADAPTSWLVLGGIWMLIKASKHASIGWALGAGSMIGASCWFRANALLLVFILAVALCWCIRSTWSRRSAVTAALVAGCILVIAPVVIRNSIVFESFVPTGLGAGTNLWEGIGETSRANEFGAVYGDVALLDRERVELGLPDDERVSLYWPDGVKRDRERTRKALRVITAEPVWYAGVMAGRMWGLLKYAGDDSGVYGTTGVNVTPAKSLPPEWRVVPISTIVTAIGWSQSVLRFAILPLMLLGIWIALRDNRRPALLILATVFYYLVFGTALHSEIRYSLPMQAVLYVFAGAGLTWLIVRLRVRFNSRREIGD